jgi:hypothetical protein
MTKPTLQDLIQYAKEINFSGFKPEEFLDHYEMVGWVCGKARTPMKSWRAAVRVWQRNQQAWNPEDSATTIETAWRKAYAEITTKIWYAMDTGSKDDVSRAISSVRDSYRDCPKWQNKDVVTVAVNAALNNKREKRK